MDLKYTYTTYNISYFIKANLYVTHNFVLFMYTNLNIIPIYENKLSPHVW
jgi:hypothetical protein